MCLNHPELPAQYMEKVQKKFLTTPPNQKAWGPWLKGTCMCAQSCLTLRFHEP